MTDEQLKFFHHVTGYNLRVEAGGTWGVYDDEGNMTPSGPAGAGSANAVWQLAVSILGPAPTAAHAPAASRVVGTAQWFADFVDNMKKAGVSVPDAGLTGAKAYFDDRALG